MPCSSFQTREITVLAASGWARCPSVSDAVSRAGLPAISADYLRATFAADHWRFAEVAVEALRARFSATRFAGEVTWGLVLVPHPDYLDTRGPIDSAARLDQLGVEAPDLRDPRLPAGERLALPGPPWMLVASVTGTYGPALGSFDDVNGALGSIHRVRRRHPHADDPAGLGREGASSRPAPARL